MKILYTRLSFTAQPTFEYNVFMHISKVLWRDNALESEIKNQLSQADISEKVRREVNSKSEFDTPLVVLMHGWGSNEADLPGVLSAIENLGSPKLRWVSLQAPIKMPKIYGSEAYAWIAEAVHENSEQLKTEAKQTSDVVVEWINQNLPKDLPIIPMGFSQGALMVSELVKRSLDLNAEVVGAIAMSGFVSQNEAQSDSIKQISTFFSYGLADDIVPLEKLTSAASWFKNNTNATVCKYPYLTHTIDFDVATDIKTFLLELLKK
jgi:phospholipase/carboxylesterase